MYKPLHLMVRGFHSWYAQSWHSQICKTFLVVDDLAVSRLSEWVWWEIWGNIWNKICYDGGRAIVQKKKDWQEDNYGSASFYIICLISQKGKYISGISKSLCCPLVRPNLEVEYVQNTDLRLRRNQDQIGKQFLVQASSTLTNHSEVKAWYIS